MTRKIYVAGATGHLGTAVVAALCSSHHDVVALARNTSSANIDHLQNLGAKVEFVDATQERYDDVVEKAGTCVSCMAARVVDGSGGGDFYAIDRDANIAFGRAALKSGSRHLILVATFEGKGSRSTSEFTNAKEMAVDVLRSESEQYGAKLTVIRPNAYFKDFTDHTFEKVASGGRRMVIGDGSMKINPVAKEDVATFISDCVEEKHPPGKDYPIGGPDIYTKREIGLLAMEVLGKAPEDLRVRHIPLWCLWIVATVLGFFSHWSTRVHRKVAIIRWMLYVSTHDGVAPCCGKRRLREHFEEVLKNGKYGQQ